MPKGKSNTPKRHHYIPELILKRFTDKNGKLHCFDKKRPARNIFSELPSEIFLEGHLYSTRDENYQADPALEIKFSKLEGKIEPIVEKIVSSARRGVSVALSATEINDWNTFFYYQWTRVPETFRETLNDNQLDKLIENFFDEYSEDVSSWTEEERQKWKDPNWLKRTKLNITVDALAYPGSQTQEFLKEKGIVAAVITNNKKSFIIGSKPIVKLAYQNRTHISDATVEAWFPISSDVAVTPAPTQKGIVKPLEISDYHIRKLNMHICKQSSIIASRSDKLTRSLVGKRS